jgi:DNA-binding MarR family transcriptional regulator
MYPGVISVSTEPEQAIVKRIADECLATRVRILNRAITSLYDDALRPFGVKVSQLNILVVTAKLGVARPARICDILHMDASTLSRNADRMAARGWLEVIAGDDARTQPLRVTKLGMRLLVRAAPSWEKAQAKAHALLGDSGTALLKASPQELLKNPSVD